MRGLLILSDSRYAKINPEPYLADAARLNIKILWKRAAEDQDPPLLPSLQASVWQLKRSCSWICVMAEGDLAADALILAAQLPVDRLILVGDGLSGRRASLRQRRRNAFAMRNLPLVTAEIIAVEMSDRLLRSVSSTLGFHSGGLMRVTDTAQLWEKRESFLTAAFQEICDP